MAQAPKVKQNFLDGFADAAAEEVKERKMINAGKGAISYPFDVVTSAMQKEVRKGDEEKAVYWALLLNGAAPYYCWKRVLIIAGEEIGIGHPEVVAQVSALALSWKLCKDSGAYFVSPHALVMAIMLMCRAQPKSTEVEDLLSLTEIKIGLGQKLPLLPEYLDAHTKEGKDRHANYDEWYADRMSFGIPLNQYTPQIWRLKPEWKPKNMP